MSQLLLYPQLSRPALCVHLPSSLRFSLPPCLPPSQSSPFFPWTGSTAAALQRMHTGTASVSPPSRTLVQGNSEVKQLQPWCLASKRSPQVVPWQIGNHLCLWRSNRPRWLPASAHSVISEAIDNRSLFRIHFCVFTIPVSFPLLCLKCLDPKQPRGAKGLLVLRFQVIVRR